MDEILTPLVKKYIGSIVRTGLKALGGWLIGQGIVSDAQWTEMAPGLITLGGALLWSLWEKRDSLRKLFTGLAMPRGTTLEEVKNKMATGVKASAGTAADETPQLVSKVVESVKPRP